MFLNNCRKYSSLVMDYSKFFTEKSGRRKGNLIRKIVEVSMAYPKSVALAGGLPNPKTFPFKEINVTYKDGTTHRLVDEELDTALQYGASNGYQPLIKIWRELQNKWHSPPRDDWDVVVTTGSQEASSKILELFIEEGDPVMVQVPAYTGTVVAIQALAPEFIAIEQDGSGIIPDKIEEICEARKQKGLPLPKLLCVNPTGANPTGAVLTEERRRAVYALAQKYNFLILEDDAYYFVNFLDYKPTSFFSLDTDGRVIRLDSFSKILSAGIRIGILSAHRDIARKITQHISSSSLHTSSLSQMLVYKLLNSWGPEKFEEHLQGIRAFYKQKCDAIVLSAEKHLTGLAEWTVPKGGMFLWLKVKDIDDVYDLVMTDFSANGVLLVPGHAFDYNSGTPNQHLRISYSTATPEDIDKGLSIVAERIRKKLGEKKVNGSVQLFE